jgi:hypothetical protein
MTSGWVEFHLCTSSIMQISLHVAREQAPGRSLQSPSVSAFPVSPFPTFFGVPAGHCFAFITLARGRGRPVCRVWLRLYSLAFSSLTICGARAHSYSFAGKLVFFLG